MKTKQKINLRVLYSKNTAIIAAFSGNFSSGINPKFGRSDSTSIADLLLYCGSWVITYSTSWKYTKYVHGIAFTIMVKNFYLTITYGCIFRNMKNIF